MNYVLKGNQLKYLTSYLNNAEELIKRISYIKSEEDINLDCLEEMMKV